MESEKLVKNFKAGLISRHIRTEWSLVHHVDPIQIAQQVVLEKKHANRTLCLQIVGFMLSAIMIGGSVVSFVWGLIPLSAGLFMTSWITSILCFMLPRANKIVLTDSSPVRYFVEHHERVGIILGLSSSQIRNISLCGLKSKAKYVLDRQAYEVIKLQRAPTKEPSDTLAAMHAKNVFRALYEELLNSNLVEQSQKPYFDAAAEGLRIGIKPGDEDRKD